MIDRIPAEGFPVGEYIVEEIKERHWSIKRLAELSGIDKRHLQDIIAGRVRVDAISAERLGNTLGTSAIMWINLDMAHRHWQKVG